MFRSTRRRLDELDSEIKGLKATIKGLTLEWENTYDKLRQQASRIEKRAYDAQRRTNDEGAVPQDPPVDEITARIHQRRGMRHVR